MHSQDPMNGICFIMLSPQMGENIGAVARVMSNFGITNLRIVSPRDGWPNQKATELAAHGAFVLEQALVFENLQDAMSDLHFLIATSANRRKMEKPVYTPSDSALEVAKRLQCGNKVGILFGRESSGLSNSDMIRADALCAIETSPINSSLNVAQAACILAYEIGRKCSNIKISGTSALANKAEMEIFFSQLRLALTQSGFFTVKEKEEIVFSNIINAFVRADMTSQEVKTMMGVVKSLRGVYERRETP